MKKYSVLYTRKETGEQFWSWSDDGRGGSYQLRRKLNEIPTHYEAQVFYGENAIKRAKKRILADQKFGGFNFLEEHYNAEVVEYEAEPEWYFELRDVLEYDYDQPSYKEVSENFPLDKNIIYELRPGHERPLIYDLSLEELERYYKWCKEHYKGTKKEI